MPTWVLAVSYTIGIIVGSITIFHVVIAARKILKQVDQGAALESVQKVAEALQLAFNEKTREVADLQTRLDEQSADFKQQMEAQSADFKRQMDAQTAEFTAKFDAATEEIHKLRDELRQRESAFAGAQVLAMQTLDHAQGRITALLADVAERDARIAQLLADARGTTSPPAPPTAP